MAISLFCIVAVALQLVVPTSGHSYLAAPAARNAIAAGGGGETCPHCLQAGGPSTVSDRAEAAGGSWPSNSVPESHGLCGDPVQGKQVATDWRTETYLTPTSVQATYTAGEIVTFVIAISTHHQGHYEFKLCNKTISGSTLSSRAEGQACLDAYTLERAPLDPTCSPNNGVADCQPIDTRHPGRWYLPPGGEGTPSSDTDANLPYDVSEVHVMKYKIPDGFQCDSCTLQWYWATGNSCLYDIDYKHYFQVDWPAAGWSMTDAGKWCQWCVSDWANEDTAVCGGRDRGFGEEFWNCADIAVNPGSGTQPRVPGVTTTTTTAATVGTTATAGGGTCTCSASTSWDGSFGQFEANPSSFCAQDWSTSDPYISGGGGNGYSGGHSGGEPCSSGQYSFSAAEGWKITVPDLASGMTPYRAFAYIRFCNGQQNSNCWNGMSEVTFSFSFKTTGFSQISAFLKLLFWGDGDSILGVLPPTHPNGEGQFRLISFPNDDYPQANSWIESVVIEENTWYHVDVTFTPSTRVTSVQVGGGSIAGKTSLGSNQLGVDMLTATNGPQIGVYSFDYSGSTWPQGGVNLWLNDMCVGSSSGTCPSSGNPVSPPAPTPPAPTPPATTTVEAPATTAAPAPPPTAGTTLAPSCEGLDVCVKLNNTFMDLGCQNWNGDQTGCEGSFITHDDLVVPCYWMACNDMCIAKATLMKPCPESAVSCSCTSVSSWSDTQCRSWCQGHPTWCSGDCSTMCSTSCSCNNNV